MDLDVALPSGSATLIVPVFAPLGTFTVICVAVSLAIVAFTPSNVTRVAPERFVPLIVTTAPTGPEVGLKLVIVGAVTLNDVAVLTFPSGITISIFPVV